MWLKVQIFFSSWDTAELKQNTSTAVLYFKVTINWDLSGKASAYNTGDPGLIPGSGRSAQEGQGNPL